MPALPASMQFVKNEFLPPNFKSLSTDDVARRFRDKGWRRDLEEQCLGTLAEFPYVDLPDAEPVPGELVLYAAGGLSPLSSSMKCKEAQCRFNYVDQFAQATALYADAIVITDQFTGRLLDPISPLGALTEILVVARLAALAEAGVVRFSRGSYVHCAGCARTTRRVQKEVERTIWDALSETADVIPIKYGRRYRLAFGSPLIEGTDVRFSVPVDAKTARALGLQTRITGKQARDWLKRSKRYLAPTLSQYAHALVFEATMGAFSGATLATHVPLAARAMRTIDGRGIPTRSSMGQFLPSVSLPYVENLSTVEVLEVREKARKALPAFRARLQRDLLSAKPGSNNDERAARLAADLKLEAAELNAELQSLKLKSVARRERLLSITTFLLTMVGLGTRNTEVLIAGAATMASALAAIHDKAADRERRHAVIQSQPASVLLTAKALHQHVGAPSVPRVDD